MLAQRLGKQRIVAETGAGQHGVATATICARFGLECVVFMGSEDIRRQEPNVQRMRLLGAEVQPVEVGKRTLKEATSEAIRDWITNVETTYYLIGSVVGPAPYPELVQGFQRVIGDETRAQILEAEGRLPNSVIACVGGGSNAIGMFTGFIADENVALIGVEAADAASLQDGAHSSASRVTLGGARGRVGADPRRSLDLRPVSTTRASAQSTRGSVTRAVRATSLAPTPKRSRCFRSWRVQRASSRPSNPPTLSRGSIRPKAISSSSASRARRQGPRRSAPGDR